MLYACGQSGGKINQEAVREEMAEHEIKRVLPGDVVEAAYEQGDAIFQVLQQKLPKEAEITSAKAFSAWVQETMGSTVDSLHQIYEADIKWIAPQDTANSQITPLERQLLNAYLYNVVRKMEVNDNVQMINDAYYLYNKPLFYNIPKQKMAGKHAVQSDSVIFLGMWSMHLSKKNIVQDM